MNALARRHTARHLVLATAAALALSSGTTSQAATRVEGVVAAETPFAGAAITIADADGKRVGVTAARDGNFAADVDGLRAPLLLSAIEAGDNTNCRHNDRPRARCMAAYLPTLKADADNTANINPLTDRVASDIAVSLKYIGPQQMVDGGKAPAADPAAVKRALDQMRAGFSSALGANGVHELADFDPVTRPMRADGQGVSAVLAVINHTRNYDNNTGESSYTVLTDVGFRPIVGLLGAGAYEPLDYPRAARELDDIRNARTRVLVVGDSTAATYERERMPRMGWGQVFQEQFKPDSGVKVVNGARAGRSARDFYNSGWYAQMARFLRPGDYVIIHHAHNDENCDSRKPVRGPADVTNLCAYPNDVSGHRQYPADRPELSFQTALEKYIVLARMAGATPIIMTPTTRFWNADRKTAFEGGDTRPVVPNHITEQNATGGFAFIGDYSQTVRDTARANDVPLIDIDARTVAFANAHASDWKQYWLAIDPKDARYPYYATQSIGTLANPDTTHFQQPGAEAIAGMVADGIRDAPALNELAGALK
ncbi:SGNH/GDSL hydrolase family protein [Uliginosibacterium sp. sgz301328]|uniref:SGNH/GDSL hydrolase family protein n=1 Tax=Uliginosibacterium sp. sgz301328 TaxID=3243764 RepID=UPI00359DC83F